MLTCFGCATPLGGQLWQIQLWQQQENTTELPEIGQIETENLTFCFCITEFQEIRKDYDYINNKLVDKVMESFIGISVACKNTTDETSALEFSPIQVIDASAVLVKPLPLDYVMYKRFGGHLRENAQQARLDTLNRVLPVRPRSGRLLDRFAAVLINIFGELERQEIITEMYRKEASPYDLYYESFIPASLPPGVAIIWTEYYPYSTDQITVMLQGQRVNDGVTFRTPAPLQPPPKKAESPPPKPSGKFGTDAIVIGAVLAIPLALILIANL
jgi:hypothetical protein